MRIIVLLAILSLPFGACSRGSERRAESTAVGEGVGSNASPANRAASAAPVAPTRAAAAENGTGETIEVKMVEQSPTVMRFEPAEVTVHQGDVVRFVDTGVQPHNVAFLQESLPAGANLGPALLGPYVTQQGQVYELRIDQRFPPGRYEFICQPHQAFGMQGALVVQP